MTGMSDRTSMNVSLPRPMRKWVADRVAEGGYGTVSEFFRELVREAQRQHARAEIEKALAESLASPASEMTESDWAQLRHRARKADAAARKRAAK